MAIVDPTTGARSTPEQQQAIESQVGEGLRARLHGRILDIEGKFKELSDAQKVEKTRVDGMEQKTKLAESGVLEKVSEHLKNRESNLVLVTTELRGELEVLKKDFAELVNRINGQQPGFFTQTPMPPKADDPSKAKVVPEKVPAPAPAPMRTPAQVDAERRRREQEHGGGA